MLVNSMNFRQLDRKWFLLEKKKDIKRMNHLFHLKNKIYPVLVYAYIDHEFGISLRIIGTIEVENEKVYLDKKRIEKRLDIIRYSEMENLDMSPVDDKVIANVLFSSLVEEEMDHYYDPYKEVLITRKKKELDEYRDSVMPDIVTFLMIDKDHRKEFLEGRIEGYDETRDIYCAMLVDDPTQEFDLEAGDMVLLKLIDRPNYKGLAFMKKTGPIE